MCATCDADDLAAPVANRRRKLWEIPSQWHCTILGTCLSMADIRAVAQKFRLRFESPRPTDYEMHSAMVGLASRDRTVSKVLHKMLDRKFAPALRRLTGVVDEAQLQDAWRRAVEEGDVAPLCWAIMSHPAASDGLRTVIFGEIHMLSHQVGAAAQSDLRRLMALEQEKEELTERNARLQARLRDEVLARDGKIAELTQRLECEMAETRRLAHAAESAARLAGLESMVAELHRQLEQETRLRSLTDVALRDALADLRERDRRLDQAEQEVAALQGEVQQFEAQWLTGAGDGVASCAQDCNRPDLCGRCILFVGGRNHHVHHFRKLVEQCNGTLIHHDGGMEDSVGRLPSLFNRADAVLLPVDAVSHAAHDEVKKLCRRWDKPFVPVRRSGIGAFLHALQHVSQ